MVCSVVVVGVYIKVFDVFDCDVLFVYVEDVVLVYLFVDVVINNVGLSVVVNFVNGVFEDFEWVMDVNFWGVVYGLKVFFFYF